MRLTTYQDLVDHLVDYLGGATSDEVVRYARRAAQDAYNELPAVFNWSYLYTRGRITTNAPQSTGTIAYTNSSLTVTLTGATWPSWVVQGVIVINNIPYQIATNPTATTITLPPQNNPGADVAAGTAYTLYMDAYSLPIDFTQTDEIVNVNQGLRLSFEHPSLWLMMQRIYRGPATPRLYSIFGSTAFFGAMSCRLYPPPDNTYFLDFVYKRRPRPLSVPLYIAGTVSTTSGSLTVTGSGTSWDTSMIGSVIRFSAPANNVAPTGPSGENPFAYERTILSVSGTTSLAVDADPAVTQSGIAYAISDPLDIEEGAMLSFLLRLAEKQMRRGRRLPPVAGEEEAYAESLARACEADNRSSMRQSVGDNSYPRRLKDFPSGPDMG